MSEHKCYLGIVLVSLVTISLLTALLITPSVFPQETENVFQVSPGEFTARDAPPLGSPYIIPQVLVVYNRDNVERLVYVKAEIPPENDVRPGYEPIENENWVIPLPSSVLIPENSYKEIQISFNIPRRENLTNKKWEVWVSVMRQPLPGEIGVLNPTVRIKIETTAELPPPPGTTKYLIPIAIVIAIIIIIAICVWIWSRKMGERKPKKVVISRSRR
jgi:hypothetical protein